MKTLEAVLQVDDPLKTSKVRSMYAPGITGC